MKRAVLIFWTVVFILIYLGVAAWAIENRAEVCVSSMTVEIGKEPIVNPVTCAR